MNQMNKLTSSHARGCFAERESETTKAGEKSDTHAHMFSRLLIRSHDDDDAVVSIV